VCWDFTYAGARVVFKKVDLQMLHWISLACSLTLSCDFATFTSLSLRSRLDAALAPYFASLSAEDCRCASGMRRGKEGVRFPFLWLAKNTVRRIWYYRLPVSERKWWTRCEFGDAFAGLFVRGEKEIRQKSE